MQIHIPLGARLAAERAYADLPREHRNDPARVAEVILTASVPFLGPAVARLGRTRITPTGASDIFRLWLGGQTCTELADRFSVSDATIKSYVRRGLERSRSRIEAGVPASTIAAENQISCAGLLAALDLPGGRRGA